MRTRTAWVQTDGDETFVLAGLTDLVVLKSTGSEFHGFPRDRYTVLAETDDRVLATSVTATWRYAPGRRCRLGTRPYAAIRAAMLDGLRQHPQPRAPADHPRDGERRARRLSRGREIRIRAPTSTTSSST
jgi:hypothetical protein